MFAVKSTALFAFIVGALFTGCATTSSKLTEEVKRREATIWAGSSRETPQAFASETHDFRCVVEDRDADKDEVRYAFHELSDRYHELREQVDRVISREAEIRFQDLTQAYLDIEGEMTRDEGRLASD
jgi:hypothetical protein